MDPTLEEKQNDSSEQNQPAGKSVIDTLNNLSQARNLARGIGKKIGGQTTKLAAQAAARGALAFFATPPGWIVLGVIAGIFVFVFLFVLINGESKYSSQTNASPTSPSPTLSPKPTIILPAGL